MTSSDQDVVSRFLQGDAEAVATVQTWISRAAWPYQRRLSARWEDVLQDVRLEVTRLLGAGSFRGESSLRTYLWQVVSHTCLDQLRSLSRWHWAELEELDAGAAPAGPRLAAKQEDRDLVRRVMRQVPADCREMWSLIAMGYSYGEMSERLGVAAGTLRVRVLRCREKATILRRELLATNRQGGRNRSAAGSPTLSERADDDGM